MKNRSKTVHFTGIKGVGMTALAVFVKEAGFKVTGSDVDEIFITDEILKKHKIEVFKGFSEENIQNADIVIATGAHDGSSNIEVLSAQKKQIPVFSLGEAVGKLMAGQLFTDKNYFCISVAGTHGKTTTTGIAATMLSVCNLDPSYLIGTSVIPSLPDPGHFGKGKYFVVEADEYATDTVNKKPRFLWQHPQVILLTNVDYDHPDVYSSLADVEKAFLQFVDSLPEFGFVIAFGDDENVQSLLKKTKKRKITYGFSPKNDYFISRLTIEGDHMFFTVEAKGMQLGDFFVNIAGRHNALNALAAVTLGIELGLSVESVRQGIGKYKGAKRRMEYLGKMTSGAAVYDDYAHHPKEIQETIKALRAMHPNKKLTVVFQPHTFSRTKKLFEQFISSLKLADTVGLMDIFASAREAKDDSVTSEALSSRLKLEGREAHFLKTQPDVIEYLDKTQPGAKDVIVFMGAGDIYKIKDQLVFE